MLGAAGGVAGVGAVSAACGSAGVLPPMKTLPEACAWAAAGTAAAGATNGIGADAGGATGGATGAATAGVAGAPPGLAGAVLHLTRRMVVGTADWLMGNASGMGALLTVSVDFDGGGVSSFFSAWMGGRGMGPEGVGSAKKAVAEAAGTDADGLGSAKNGALCGVAIGTAGAAAAGSSTSGKATFAGKPDGGGVGGAEGGTEEVIDSGGLVRAEMVTRVDGPVISGNLTIAGNGSELLAAAGTDEVALSF